MRILFFIVFIGTCTLSGAQNILDRSLKKYQEGELEQAKLLIDSALTSELYAAENITWYLKGFIYKDLFKANQNSPSTEELRKSSLSAFKRLLRMDTLGTYKDDTRQNIKFLATTYYNDAMRLLEQRRFKAANVFYSKFVATYSPISDGSISLRESELRYHLAVGTAYVQMQIKDSLSNYNPLAIVAFEHVLQLDSMNKEANYNIGAIYYNKAVNRIEKLDYDDLDLLAFGKFEDETIVLFKRSLPYMLRAYKVDDQDKNVLEGLAGIHFSLREFEISDRYTQELLALEDSTKDG
ncbi:MAG: hypothetical protein AAGF85_17725 [Bacteroidota bacterium]